MVRSRPSSWRGASGDSATTSPTPPQRPTAPALTLERVIGQTCLHNSALAVNPITGDVAYPAGCVVVIYQPRRNRQFRYFRASKAVSCLAFSRDGGMLAVGERGHQPSATVWSLATGTVVRELAGGHRFGIGCIAFTPSGGGVVTMGFKHDRMLRVWDLRLAADPANVLAPERASGRSASPISGYPSSDPDSPPPPPPPPYPSSDGETLIASEEATAAAAGAAPSPGIKDEARQVASARIPKRVRAIDFTSDGECLVTCGDGHVKFWKMPGGRHTRLGGAGGGFIGIGADAPPSKAATPSTPVARGASKPPTEVGKGETGEAGATVVVVALEGWPATIMNELKDATFVDVSSSGKGGGGGGGGSDGGSGGGGAGAAGLDSVFCVTSEGVLCAFTRGGVMEHWVSLETPAAYGLSVHEDGTLAAACADGLVRLFKADDLRYVATLPRPPPLGRANISSVRELQEIADLSAVAAKAAKAVSSGGGGGGGGVGAVAAEENDDVNVGTIGDDTAFSEANGVRAGGGSAIGGCTAAVRYPAALGCRLSPSGTKVVCIYADRGLFIWDVKDPLCVGKYRSFLAHGGCIWDVQRMPARISPTPPEEGDQPSPLPDLPAGAMVTCSADNTVRLWDLGALDGNAAGDVEKHHSGRWSNIYSKHLLRVLYGGEGGAGDANGDRLLSSEGKMASGPVSLNRLPRDEATIEETALSEGSFDPEVPHKPEWSCSPRSLALHPDGSQVACGDKAGNIRVYDLTQMELAHSQFAHDAEVLCLAYSPMMIPAYGGRATTPSPRSPPDGGGGVSGAEEAKHGTGETKAPRSAEDGVGMGASGVSSSSPSLFLASVGGDSAQRARKSEGIAGGAGVSVGFGGDWARSVSSWEAVDPLDPAGAAEKMLSLSFVSSLSSMTALKTDGNDAGGAATAGGGGDCGSINLGGTNQSVGLGAGGKEGGLVPPSVWRGGGGRGHHQRDCGTPLVLLASASRDRLVHIFDASLCSRGTGGGGRGAEATTTAATTTSASMDSGGVHVRVEAGAATGRASHGRVAESPGLDMRLGGKATTANARAGVGAGAETVRTAGFPLLKTLDSHSGSVTAVKFTKDGKRLISAGGDKLLVLNSVRGPHVHRLRAVSVPQGTIYGLDVDPTNNYVVTAGQDKRLNIWSTASGKHVRAYKVEPSTPQTTEPLTFSSSTEGDGGGGGGGGGRATAAGGVAGGGPGAKGEAGGELFKVDLDPTGMYAAACSFDKWIRLFDFYSGKCLAKVAGHSELATGVRFTPDGRRLITTGGDGVMFVWRLSSELQQSMHDRMCELRPAGSTAGSGGINDTGDGGRGTTTSSTSGCDSGRASDTATPQVVPAPVVPVSTSRAGVPRIAADHASGRGSRSRGEGGNAAGSVEPQATPAKATAETARAKAKADAKARLRFQRYQLPAWAHTQQGSNLSPTAAATTTTQAPRSSSPTATAETTLSGDSNVVGQAASDRAEAKLGDNGVRDSPGGGDVDAKNLVGESATSGGTSVGAAGGEPVVEGRDSPPPVLAALVSAAGSGSGSFSRDRRDSSSGSNSKNELSYSSSINDTHDASTAVETPASSNDNAVDGGPCGRENIERVGASPHLHPPPPPLPAEEAEAAAERRRSQEQQHQHQRQQEKRQNTTGNNPTAATTTTSLLRNDSGTAAAAAATNSSGSLAVKTRAGWGLRREGSGKWAGISASGAASTATPAVAGGSRGEVLAAARGRWERRGVQVAEGSLEIVGHQTGNKSRSAKNTGSLSASSLEKRNGERRWTVREDAASAIGAVPIGTVEEVVAGSRDDQEGVKLGGSDDDADEHEYSLDDDFEEVGRMQEQTGTTPTTVNPGSSSPGPGDESGDGVSQREEPCSGGGALLPNGNASDPAKGRLPRHGGNGVNTNGDSNQDVVTGSPGDAAAAAAAVAGLQRKVAEKTTAHSVAVATAAATAAAAAAASAPQERKEPGESGSPPALDSKCDSGDSRDGGAKALHRRSGSLRSRASSSEGGAAVGIPAVENSASSSTMGSESSASVAAEQRDEDAAKRGRRISETEGAVKTMRRKLSAMGFLEAEGSDCSGGGGDAVGGAGLKLAGEEDSVANLSMGTLLESPGQPPRPDAAAADVVSAHSGGGGGGGGGAAAAAVRAADKIQCLGHIDEMGATDERENRRTSTETATAPPAAGTKEGEQPPLPPPSPPPSPPHDAEPPLPSAEQGRDRGAAANEPSDGLAMADVRVTTDDPDNRVSGTPVGVDNQRSPSRLLQTPEDRAAPPGSCGSALSSGRRRYRRRRKHTSTAEEGESPIGCRRQASPNSPVGDRVVVLPRPDVEYEAALLRLTEAASHAAELYRELTQASSASLASRGTAAGGTSEGSVVGMESFPATSSSGLERESLGLGGVAGGRAQAGVRRGEGKHDTTSGSGAAFGSASSEVPLDTDIGTEDSDSADEYEDDDEWETEEEAEGDGTDPDGSAERRRGRGRGRRGASDPLSLERSFRESFASVNGVLSAIAGKTSGGTFVDGFCVGAGTDGTGGDVAVGRRNPKPSSIPTGDTVGGEVAEGGSLPASPDPTSLPPREVLRQAQSRETASGGDGHSESAFRLSPGSGGEAAMPGGVSEGLGGRAGEDEQMPPEMSGMLQRYSEMMLKVVQEKMEARMADGTLGPNP